MARLQRQPLDHDVRQGSEFASSRDDLRRKMRYSGEIDADLLGI